MLGPNHSHPPRVRALLEAARAALRDGNWQFTSEPIGLELIVYAAEGRDPWDAITIWVAPETCCKTRAARCHGWT